MFQKEVKRMLKKKKMEKFTALKPYQSHAFITSLFIPGNIFRKLVT